MVKEKKKRPDSLESGLKHEVLPDRKMGGGIVSEARSRHPTCKEIE